jgi:serine/threonine protein kinase
MRGGDLIGEGSYGCVFDPPLLCKGDTEPASGKVSKLLLTSDAADEEKENRIINKIDPKFKWHLKSDKRCKVKIPETFEYIDHCTLARNRDLSKFRNIIQEHGGESVAKYITTKPLSFSKKESKHKHFINLFLQSENLLVGIKELFEKNMCHFDIKSDNAVYNENKKRFNFIDFGLTRPIDDVQNFDALWRAYWVWPLDVWLCYNDHANQYIYTNKHTALLGSVFGRYNRSYAKTVVLNHCAGLGNPYLDCLNNTTKISEYNDYIKTHSYPTFIRRVSESIDTFSLGIMYMQMMVAFTGEKFNIGLCTLNPSLNHYNELKTIHDFINLMLTSNSLHRMRAPEIYNYFIKNVKPILNGTASKSRSINNAKLHNIILQAPSIKRSGEITSRKRCPDGQIFDPNANRCVSRKGSIGKKLVNRRIKRSAMVNISRAFAARSNKTRKICPPGKILNPKTNRCVLATGAIGRKLARA